MVFSKCLVFNESDGKEADGYRRPVVEHTELENELHEKAHIDYDRVAIVCTLCYFTIVMKHC